jgi:hypothetical protein
MGSADDLRELWMLVRSDAQYRNYLMHDGFPDKPAADAHLAAFLARQTKVHGQTYELHPYTPATRADVIRKLDLIL